MSRYNLLALMTLAVICAVSAQIFNPPSQKCPANESYSTCGKMCEPSCANKNPNWVCQVLPCFQFLTGGCRCNTDFVRSNINGPCIPSANCPN